MELKDTAAGMTSPDFKERFKAEFDQVNIRLCKLDQMITKYQLNELAFTPKCSLELLTTQLHILAAYREILLERARIEGIAMDSSLDYAE